MIKDWRLLVNLFYFHVFLLLVKMVAFIAVDQNIYLQTKVIVMVENIMKSV